MKWTIAKSIMIRLRKCTKHKHETIFLTPFCQYFWLNIMLEMSFDQLLGIMRLMQIWATAFLPHTNITLYPTLLNFNPLLTLHTKYLRLAPSNQCQAIQHSNRHRTTSMITLCTLPQGVETHHHNMGRWALCKA